MMRVGVGSSSSGTHVQASVNGTSACSAKCRMRSTFRTAASPYKLRKQSPSGIRTSATAIPNSRQRWTIRSRSLICSGTGPVVQKSLPRVRYGFVRHRAVARQVSVARSGKHDLPRRPALRAVRVAARGVPGGTNIGQPVMTQPVPVGPPARSAIVRAKLITKILKEFLLTRSEPVPLDDVLLISSEKRQRHFKQQEIGGQSLFDHSIQVHELQSDGRAGVAEVKGQRWDACVCCNRPFQDTR